MISDKSVDSGPSKKALMWMLFKERVSTSRFSVLKNLFSDIADGVVNLYDESKVIVLFLISAVLMLWSYFVLSAAALLFLFQPTFTPSIGIPVPDKEAVISMGAQVALQGGVLGKTYESILVSSMKKKGSEKVYLWMNTDGDPSSFDAKFLEEVSVLSQIGQKIGDKSMESLSSDRVSIPVTPNSVAINVLNYGPWSFIIKGDSNPVVSAASLKPQIVMISVFLSIVFTILSFFLFFKAQEFLSSLSYEVETNKAVLTARWEAEKFAGVAKKKDANRPKRRL